MAFAPIGTTDGSDWHGKLREVNLDAAIANTFLGDMMTSLANGPADGRAEDVDIATVGDVAAAGAVSTNQLLGAVVEFTPDFTDEGTLIRNFHLTGAAQLAKLVYGSDVIYEAPANVALALTDIGTNKNLSLGAGGSIVTGIGTHGIGADSATALAQLRIIGASKTEDDLGLLITAVGATFAGAVSTNQLLGAVVEFTPDFTDEGTLIRNFHLTGAAQLAKLVYGSDVIYEAPANVALALTDIGTNKNLSLGAGGSIVTGIGTHGIGADSATALAQLRIIGASKTEDDLGLLITAVGATWRCRINASPDDHRVVGAV